MEANFWHERWQKREIAFHEKLPNSLLVDNFGRLNLPANSRVFVPLCGKTLDIGWLLSQGYRVVGAELSEVAVVELFAELKLQPQIKNVGPLKHYSASGIDIFVGDIFDLTAEILGNTDAIYDRAALVALPEAMRSWYAGHLMAITNVARQLVITFEYDQSVIPGPPFSITAQEIKRHYNASYRIELLQQKPLQGGLKGRVAADECVWRLDRGN